MVNIRSKANRFFFHHRLIFQHLEQAGSLEIADNKEKPTTPLSQETEKKLDIAGKRIRQLSDDGYDPSGADKILNEIKDLGNIRATGAQMPNEQEIGKTKYPVALFQVANPDGIVTDYRYTVEQLQQGEYPQDKITDEMARQQINFARNFKDEYINTTSPLGEKMRAAFSE